MSNKSHRLYVGATNDLIKRVRQHKEGTYPNGFTARYRFNSLVYYEPCDTYPAAIKREGVVKGWRRSKKVALIQSMNPWWHDLTQTYLDLLEAK